MLKIPDVSAPESTCDPLRSVSGGYDESSGYDDTDEGGVRWCAHLWPKRVAAVDPSARIHPMAIIGSPPQSPTRPRATGPVIIGAGTVVREFASVDRPMREPKGETRVGRNVYQMAMSHVSHDAQIDDYAVLSAGAITSGYTRVMHHATLGLRSCTHQHVIVGPYAFVGLGAVVIEDVPPYMTCIGTPARYHGVNRVGLERDGWTTEQIDTLTRYMDLACQGDEMPSGNPRNSVIDARITLLADDNVRAFCDAREARGPKRKMLPGWDWLQW